MLKYTEFDKVFEMHTDTSSFAIGGVLMQDEHLVTYESQKLTGNQLRWRTMRNNCTPLFIALRVGGTTLGNGKLRFSQIIFFLSIWSLRSKQLLKR